MKPKALIIQAQGTNRDVDVQNALNLAGAQAIGIPLNILKSNQNLFSDFQILVVAGGFSYADALGAGKLLALDLASYFADQVAAFVKAGKPVIGICNGFQALIKAGILPEHQATGNATLRTTLTFNAQGHFECRWVFLKAVARQCVWTQGLEEVITCPVAHGEGNFKFAGELPPANIALIYAHADGTPANRAYPANPNGSMLDIAGITNANGNVLGLMPHPENHIHATQHPRHTRGEHHGNALQLFINGVNFAKEL